MRTVILFFAVVVGVAAVSALATRHFVERPPQTQDAMHHWLHSQLDLTDKQREALEAIEKTYSENEARVRTNLSAANRDLASVLRENSTYTPAVAKAVENVHLQMGELQKLSIRHLYRMKTVLTPAQSDKLMEMTEAALTEPR